MISHFVIKFESFDCEAFIDELKRERPNGLAVVWNYSGQIQIRQQPDNLKFRAPGSYYSSGRWSENRWIKWPRFLILMAALITRVALTTKVEVFYIGGGDILLWYAQIFKSLGRFKKTVTTMEDWSRPSPHQSFYERLNRIKIKINDFLLARFDTTVIVYNPEIYKERQAYLGEAGIRNVRLFKHQWAWHLRNQMDRPARQNRMVIVQLGTVRDHFGMNLLFQILPALHAEHGFRLRFIGPETDIYHRYRQRAEELGLNAMIEWRGFVVNEALPEALDDCFCGVNLQEEPLNDSRLTIAGRVVQYIQHLVTPILTEYSGALVPIVRKDGIGIIITPEAERLKAAIVDAFAQQQSFAIRIEKFLSNNPYKAERPGILGDSNE